MSKKLYEESNIQDIANAIREQNGTENTYTPAQMPAAIRAIEPEPDLEALTVTENGNYQPSAGKDGFSSVAVNVPTGGGEAVIQSLSVTQNGTYSPPSGVDGYAPVTVNVPSGGGGDIVYIPYDPEYEQGSASGASGNTYAANKVSNTTRIRPVDLVDVSEYVNDNIYFVWNDSNYDIAIQQYDSNMRGAAFSEFYTKPFSVSMLYPYIDIIIRKRDYSTILPSEFASVQLKLVSLTESDFDPSHGGAVVQPLSITQNGTYAPPSGVDGYTPVTVNVPNSATLYPIFTGTQGYIDVANKTICSLSGRGYSKYDATPAYAGYFYDGRYTSLILVSTTPEGCWYQCDYGNVRSTIELISHNHHLYATIPSYSMEGNRASTAGPAYKLSDDILTVSEAQQLLADNATSTGTWLVDHNGDYESPEGYDGFKSFNVHVPLSPINLPSIYQEVEYLEVDGHGVHVILDYECQNKDTLSNRFVAAGYNSSGGNGHFAVTPSYGAVSGARCNAYAVAANRLSIFGDDVMSIYEVRHPDIIAKNGTGKQISDYDTTKETIICILMTRTLQRKLVIGAYSSSNNQWPVAGGRAYGPFTIRRENGEYCIFAVPCYRKSDNVCGYYDLCTETFYEQTGGTYTPGPNVTNSYDFQRIPRLLPFEVNSFGEFEPYEGTDGYSQIIVPESLVKYQEKIVRANGLILPDNGYDGLSRVYVMIPATSVSDIAFLKVFAYITDVEDVAVTKEGITYTPTTVIDKCVVYEITELGTYTITFSEGLTRSIEISNFYDTYTVKDIAPYMDGAYWVSYDQGDYMTWDDRRRITRTLASGQPLLFGFSLNSSGYCAPAICSAMDLGNASNVISGDYCTKRPGLFADGSTIYCYGGYNGGTQNGTVRFYKYDGTNIMTIPSSTYKISLPYPTSRPNVYARTTEYEDLIPTVELAIRTYSPSA